MNNKKVIKVLTKLAYKRWDKYTPMLLDLIDELSESKAPAPGYNSVVICTCKRKKNSKGKKNDKT